MTFYAIRQYLTYKWKAMGRHGTHSPFVYDLIESVLQNNSVIPTKYITSIPGLPLRYENILSRIAARYDYEQIVVDREPVAKAAFDMLIVDGNNPESRVANLSNILNNIKENAIIVIIGIHNTPAQGMAWGHLCKSPAVRMSIDLYGMGLLLFRNEFKVKQHFVLKNEM